MTESRAKLLSLLLRAFGVFDLLALVAVAMPTASIAWVHERLGLGSLPREPIVLYLARSASAVYALHGATLLYVSFDVRRYDQLIRFLSLAAIFHGALIVAIDVAAKMPLWWTILEGPCFAATGVAVLAARGFRDD